MIHVHLAGGPSHIDLWDPKPDAPTDVRGDTQSIATNVPGLSIGDCFPRLSRQMDHAVVLRAVVGSCGLHDPAQCFSGRDPRDAGSSGPKPSFGSVVERALGSSGRDVPASVTLTSQNGVIRCRAESAPGEATGVGARQVCLPPQISASLEYGSSVDARKLAHAVSLVNRGARSVSLSFGEWDTHRDNRGRVRREGLKLDRALDALIIELTRLDRLRDVTVIVWGEFGRTPRVNARGGRDHWPLVCSAVLLGGGLPGGQTIGSTNRCGEYATDNPVSFPEVVATLYHQLGIDPRTTKFSTPRPRGGQLLCVGPIAALI